MPEQLALDRVDVAQRERVQGGASHAADAGACGRVECAVQDLAREHGAGGGGRGGSSQGGRGGRFEAWGEEQRGAEGVGRGDKGDGGGDGRWRRDGGGEQRVNEVVVLVGVGVGRCFDADGDLGGDEFLLLGWRLREELGCDFGFQCYEVFSESVCVVG